MKGRLRSNLAAGKKCFGMGVRLARTGEIASLARDAGYDWLFLDLEHGPQSWDAISQLCVAALEADIAPFVRVPNQQPETINRALSLGAIGIIVPQMERPEVARSLSNCCRFSPSGTRTSPGGFVQLGYRPVEFAKASQQLNHETLFFAMIESKIGVENANEIAANPNVDGLLIGANDLTYDLGIPQDYQHEDARIAMETTLEAAKSHNKFCGIGGISDSKLMRSYMAMGAQLILAGMDNGLMFTGATGRLDALIGD